MALEKTESLRHEVEPNGTVFVVTRGDVLEDGKVIASNPPHRKPINPGDDYSGEADETKAICDAVQTESVVSDYAAAQAAAAPAAEEAPAEESE
jgi:hypothetical protein